MRVSFCAGSAEEGGECNLAASRCAAGSVSKREELRAKERTGGMNQQGSPSEQSGLRLQPREAGELASFPAQRQLRGHLHWGGHQCSRSCVSHWAERPSCSGTKRGAG